MAEDIIRVSIYGVIVIVGTFVSIASGLAVAKKINAKSESNFVAVISALALGGWVATITITVERLATIMLL